MQVTPGRPKVTYVASSLRPAGKRHPLLPSSPLLQCRCSRSRVLDSRRRGGVRVPRRRLACLTFPHHHRSRSSRSHNNRSSSRRSTSSSVGRLSSSTRSERSSRSSSVGRWRGGGQLHRERLLLELRRAGRPPHPILLRGCLFGEASPRRRIGCGVLGQLARTHGRKGSSGQKRGGRVARGRGRRRRSGAQGATRRGGWGSGWRVVRQCIVRAGEARG